MSHTQTLLHKSKRSNHAFSSSFVICFTPIQCQICVCCQLSIKKNYFFFRVICPANRKWIGFILVILISARFELSFIIINFQIFFPKMKGALLLTPTRLSWSVLTSGFKMGGIVIWPLLACVHSGLVGILF